HHKILLVEDEASNILIASEFLQTLGYDYDIASDGNDALRKIKSNSYSLILMDVNIPGIDGLTITGQLRRMEKEGATSYTPVIAMTAHALTEDRQKCLDAGMNDYISKPFTQAQLQQKIEQNPAFKARSGNRSNATN